MILGLRLGEAIIFSLGAAAEESPADRVFYRESMQLLESGLWLRRSNGSWNLFYAVCGDEVFTDGSPFGSRGEFLYTRDTGETERLRASHSSFLPCIAREWRGRWRRFR
jgi:hypothetical protein